MKRVTKTYGHERGYSACFRQWRAKSHCRFIHGYALSFTFVFQCADDQVDENGWVIDFGSLKPIKAFLDENFDHKLLVAEDDPARDVFDMIGREGCGGNEEQPQIADVIVVSRVGCEAFAEWAYREVDQMLMGRKLGDTHARLVSVEVREHGSNGATYVRD
jgi:6-pyruvoyltetrahydropterin/6-carboxytetrahydropterin synthase